MRAESSSSRPCRVSAVAHLSEATILTTDERTSFGLDRAGWRNGEDFFLADPGVLKIGQNLKYDIAVFNRSHYEDVLHPVVYGQISDIEAGK